MNIYKIQQLLSRFDKESQVLVKDFNFPDSNNGYLSGDYGSYRGYYNQPCLYTVDDPETAKITVAGIISILYKLTSGITFDGYKGGEFTYCNKNSLFVAPYGSSNRQVVNVIEKDGFVYLCLVDDL